MQFGEALTVGGAGNLTITGSISGSGAGLTKIGAGKTILSGSNSYDGTTTVNAGTLQVDGAQSASQVSVANSAFSRRRDGRRDHSVNDANIAPGLGTARRDTDRERGRDPERPRTHHHRYDGRCL